MTTGRSVGAPLSLAVLLTLACGPGEPPPAPGPKDAGAKTDPCKDVICFEGETCDPMVGECLCEPGTCPLPSVCNADGHCENRCAGAECTKGEECDPQTGRCECSDESCPSDEYCSTERRCVARCEGVGCKQGELCEPESGACLCDPKTCTGTIGGCEKETNRCVNLCPERCPPGESCADPLVGECHCGPGTCPVPLVCDDEEHCVDLCNGVPCGQGESCGAQTGRCECRLSPDSCPSGRHCDEATMTCASNCDSVTCPQGEACVPATGACACGLMPNTCPPGNKCDAETLHCVGNCEDVVCTTAGERCSPATGNCECSLSPSDTCTAAVQSTRCDGATRRCVPRCQGALCTVPGETCDNTTGICQCRTNPDTCTAADPTRKCDPVDLICVARCAGVGCPSGEACEAATGACACTTAPDSCTAADATLECDGASRHCVSRCLGVSCPDGESCSPSLGVCVCRPSPDSCTAVDPARRCDTGTNRCVPLCQGVSCPAGQLCAPVTGECACTSSPDSCTAADAATRCDASSGVCVPRCAGVTCPTGEACVPTTGGCACTTSPDSCSATDPTTRCSASRCVSKCAGVSCPAGQVCTPATGICRCTASPDSCAAADPAKRCDAVSGYCVSPCAGVTCGAGEACDPGSGTCSCTPTSCPSGYLCNAQQRCECAAETDQQLCSRLSKQCGSFTGFDNCGLSRTVSCGSCAAPQLCEQNACVAPPAPGNDACGGAIALSFSGGAVSVTGDTTYATNSGTSLNCLGTGKDVVYSFALSEPRNVDITLDMAAGVHAVVHLRSACDDRDTEVGCSDAAGSASLHFDALEPGTYYLWVDSYGSAWGEYTLTVRQTVVNSICSGAIAISAETTVAGSTFDATNDFGSGAPSAACANGFYGLDGKDVVYSYTPASDGVFRVRLSPVPTFDAALWIMPAPCDGAAARCGALDDDGSKGAPEELLIAGLAGQTYFIVIDAWSPTEAGGFTLAIDSPANDACDGAIPVLQKGVALKASTAGAANDYNRASASSACSRNWPGPDVVFAYVPTTADTFTVSITNVEAGFDVAVLATTGGCGDSATCAGSRDSYIGGRDETLSITTPTPNTTYFIVVDGYTAGDAGAFTIRVD